MRSYLRSFLIVTCAMAIFPSAGQAHDSMFVGLSDPTGKGGCCTGPDNPHPDCQIVPAYMMQAGVITETYQGYHVVLTLKQAKYFNSDASQAVNEVVARERLIPALGKGFAICIYNNYVRCLLGPSNV